MLPVCPFLGKQEREDSILSAVKGDILYGFSLGEILTFFGKTILYCVSAN